MLAVYLLSPEILCSNLIYTFVPPLPPPSVAAADRGDKPQQEDEEGEEIATPAFNVDKLRAETKTPFRTVGRARLPWCSVLRVCENNG